MAELIGYARCPLCESDKARLSVSKSNLAVLTCNACIVQVFARSDRADDLLRARLVPVAPPVASVSPAPTIASVPVPDAPKKKKGTGSAFDALLGLEIES